MKNPLIIIPNSKHAVRISDIDNVELNGDTTNGFKLTVIFIDGQEINYPLITKCEATAMLTFHNFIDNINAIPS